MRMRRPVANAALVAAIVAGIALGSRVYALRAG